MNIEELVKESEKLLLEETRKYSTDLEVLNNLAIKNGGN
jgi:hypothetical protein